MSSNGVESQVQQATQSPGAPGRDAAVARSPRRDPPSQVLQFTAPLFFTAEDGVACVVDIMRIGRADDTCSVRVKTEDGTAIANQKYTPVDTQVNFGPGEVMKSIKVQIMNDSLFETTLEFRCHLSEAVNCTLGKYLCTSRVLIMDDDVFPSNDFKGRVCGDDFDEEKLSRETITLVMTFMHFAFLRVPGVWWRTIVYALFDQLHNVYFLVCILLKVYMVDVVLGNTAGDEESRLLVTGDRHLTMVALAVLYVAPNLILMCVDYLKIGALDVGRLIRAHLQINLFRRYLNYTEDSKCEVPVQDLTCCMSSDIPMVVEQGYCFVFHLLRGLGKISIVSLFMLYQDWRSIFPLLLFPTTMFFFVRARRYKQVELENRLIDAEQDSAGCVVSSVDGFEIIRDYRMRHFFSDKFKDFLAEAFGAQNRLEMYGFWNGSFLPWITLGCVGSYIAFGSQLVLMQMTSLGSFLAMIDIYKEWGDRFQNLYEVIEQGIQAGSPLVQLVKMINLQTDVPHRAKRNKDRREFMKEQLAVISLGTPRDELSCAFDRMPIHVRSLKMSFTKSLQGFSSQIAAGSLVYVTGEHGMGKTTLLKILADVCPPDSGCAVYSSHNRCLYVSERPGMIPKLSLYENLTFGTKRADPNRVRSIFCRLSLDGSGLLQLLERDIADLPCPEGGSPHQPEESVNMEEAALLPARRTLSSGSDRTINRSEAAWQKQVSFSEMKRIHLARALIYNPEFLVANKPIEAIDSADRETILHLLREFVDERGVYHDKATKHLRRPRTLIFSGQETEDAKKNLSISDAVWLLKKGHIDVTQRTDFTSSDSKLNALAHTLEGDDLMQVDNNQGERMGEAAPRHTLPSVSESTVPPQSRRPDSDPYSEERTASRTGANASWRVQLVSPSPSDQGETSTTNLSRTDSALSARFDAMDKQERTGKPPGQIPTKEGKCWGRACT